MTIEADIAIERERVVTALNSLESEGSAPVTSAQLTEKMSQLTDYESRLTPYGAIFKAVDSLREEQVITRTLTEIPDPKNPNEQRKTFLYSLTPENE